jgi:hypothetical protein
MPDAEYAATTRRGTAGAQCQSSSPLERGLRGVFPDAWRRAQGSGFRVQGSGFRVQDWQMTNGK